MAEPGESRGIDRRLIMTVVGVIASIAMTFFWSFSSCGKGSSDKGYTVIYSNLDLKDAANVVTRLKELKIPYELKDEGTAVSVPKPRSAEARLGLAQKNLPLGGAVGWEIFDESKLGATDFDRRIQLIRAISGELARTIRQIDAIEDCRVQIVIPETRLFEVEKAPVTASVMLTLKAGKKISNEQVNGIVHLVASSVENLRAENVTIIDDNGRILTANVSQQVFAPVPTTVTVPTIITENVAPAVTPEATKAETKKKEESKAKEESKTKEKPKEIVAGEKTLTPEERAMLVLKAKRELENQLEGRSQSLLNRFYPPNSVVIRVNVELANADVAKVTGNDKNKELPPDFTLRVKRITAIVLVDNLFNLTEQMKEDTFSTVSAAIGYNHVRGDRIELRKVPFRYAVPPPTEMSGKVSKVVTADTKQVPSLLAKLSQSLIVVLSVLIAAIILILIVVMRRSSKVALPKESAFTSEENTEVKQEEVSSTQEETSAKGSGMLNVMKRMAEENPEKIANLLKVWLTEK
ncbi:MAG: flagellar basal-body MS-ring/collar protein FliF [Candidatus Saganbacteria bacterium]|nr:flagellar basal-body MS-ring/collar protein FliF [Candidatus Saganbacteria bacterium]